MDVAHLLQAFAQRQRGNCIFDLFLRHQVQPGCPMRALSRLVVVSFVLLSLVMVAVWALTRLDWTSRIEAALAQAGCPSDITRVNGASLRALRLGAVRLCQHPSGHLMEAEELLVVPRWSALLRGKFEASRVVLREGIVDVQTVSERLTALSARGDSTSGPSRTAVASSRLAGTVLAWENVTFRLPEGRSLSSHSGELRKEPTKWKGTVHLQGDTRLKFDANAERVLALADVGELQVWHPAVRGKAVVTAGLARDGQVWHVRWDIRSREMFFVLSKLNPEPVGPTDSRFEGTAHLKPFERKVVLEASEFSIAGTPLANAEGNARWTQDAAFTVLLRVPPTPYANLWTLLPKQLLPDIPWANQLTGRFAAQVNLSGDWRDLSNTVWDVTLDLKDMVQEARALPLPLRESFEHVPPFGTHRKLTVGPPNPNFVRIETLPQHVVRAVTVSEDAGFFAHTGFDFEEMRRSLLEPEDAKRHRGASTLTQQLAKNLFLSGERTYARKLKEALATVALEAAFPKSRLVEIYLNIVEWGPDVYGLGEAARYYFGVEARYLTPKQAAFLAIVLPSPARYHTYFRRGSLTPNAEHRVSDILEKLRTGGFITAAQLNLAKAKPLTFRVPQKPASAL
ncbi:MAG: transglycosylase domain-containing protein [Myxococcaceae bacterium]